MADEVVDGLEKAPQVAAHAQDQTKGPDYVDVEGCRENAAFLLN